MIFYSELNQFATSNMLFKRPCTVECRFAATSLETMFLKLGLFGGFGYSICLANLNFRLTPNIVKIMKDNKELHSISLDFSQCMSQSVKIEAL